MSRKNRLAQEDLIIRCGTLITMVPENPILRDTQIHVSNGFITSIEPAPEDYPSQGYGKEFIDAGDCLVMPGLINSHTHAAMSMFRGLADDMPLKEWLFKKIFPAEAEHLSPHNVYWAAMLAFVEMIQSGTTCFSDGYFYQDSTMEAAQAIGIRGVVGQGVIDFPAPGIPDPSKNLDEALAFVRRWKRSGSLLSPSLFCHSPVTCSERTLKGAMEICKSEHISMQIHLAETIEEVRGIVQEHGKRPAEYLHELGILNESLIAVHCVHLERREIALLRESGTRVVHCPESNMKLASGVCPVGQILAMGITLGLGTDGCASNNDLDMFTEMDTAAKLAKVFSYDPTALKAWEVMKAATLGGARVLGLDSEIGTVEAGKKADIIVLDLDKPHLQPLYDPVSTIVYSAKGSDVRDVVIDGKAVMRNRELMTVDTEEVMRKVWEIAREIK